MADEGGKHHKLMMKHVLMTDDGKIINETELVAFDMDPTHGFKGDHSKHYEDEGNQSDGNEEEVGKDKNGNQEEQGP